MGLKVGGWGGRVVRKADERLDKTGGGVNVSEEGDWESGRLVVELISGSCRVLRSKL